MRNDNNAGDRNARVCGEPKIFIGQIPMECTQDDVLNLFRRFGTVKSASLMTHMDGRSKGCAMVLYEKWAEAEAAMDACNGNAILGGERALVVNFADPPKRGGGVPPIAPKTLFVGQVPKDSTDEEVRTLFEPYGQIVEFQVSRKGTGSGCAFIKYNKWSEAEAAMEELHGHQKIPGAKNPLVVKFADAKNKDGSDSQVGAKRPIGEDPWVNNAKRPFQGQGNGTAAMGYVGFQGTLGVGSGWPQGGQMTPYGYQGMGRGLGFGNMLGGLGSGSMMGMGVGAGYGMGANAYNPGYAGAGYGAYTGIIGTGTMGVLGGMPSMLGMGGSAAVPTSATTGGAGGKLGPGITDPRANEWKLFVGQVPYDATECDLWPIFSELGDILELVILRTNEGRSRGCAFITYADRATAERAIGRFNGQISVPGDTRGKKLVVSFAAPKKESTWNGAQNQVKAEA